MRHRSRVARSSIAWTWTKHGQPKKVDRGTRRHKQAFFDHHSRTPSLIEFEPDERLRVLRLIEHFELEPHHSVLEIGCGTGRLTKLIMPHLREGLNVAIDFSFQMLLRSHERGHGRNVLLCQADAARLPVANGAVDRVLMFCVYPHLPNPRQSVAEARRVLRERGKLIVAHALSSGEINAFHRSAGEAVADDVLPRADKLARMLDTEGFRVEQAIDEPGRYLVVAAK